MPAVDSSAENQIARTRFLLVDTDNAKLDKIERILVAQQAQKIYAAKSPFLALRTLQDRRTQVDCIICAQKSGSISGLGFLQNLRLGNWGGPSLRSTPFILAMATPDNATLKAAHTFDIDGFLFGEPTHASVADAVSTALSQRDGRSPATPYKVARLRECGIDFVIVPFNASFEQKSESQQRRVIEILTAAAAHAGIPGEVVPVWNTGAQCVAFMAPAQYHPWFQTITLDFVYKHLNRELYIEWPADLAGAAPIAAPASTAAAPADRRPFAKEDVDKVLAAFQQMGPERFVSSFVRKQPIMRNVADKPRVSLLSEYFVSVDHLRQPLFADADMRGSGNAFNHLTLALDQIVLHSFDYIASGDAPFSINLNVQTIFSTAFDTFIGRIPPGRLTIELRQSDLAKFMDKFESARERLAAKRVTIAVDQIFPDALGLVNLDILKPAMAKICWSRGADVFLREHTSSIRKMIDQGIDLVMTRVDDVQALDVGAELGIRNFQGFLIDEMIRKNAA